MIDRKTGELHEVVDVVSNYLKDAIRNKGSRLHQLQNDLYYDFGYKFNDMCNDFFCYYADTHNKAERSIHDKWDRDCELSTYVHGCVFNFLRGRMRDFIRERDEEPTDLLDVADVEITEEVEEADYRSGVLDYDFFHQEDPERAYINKYERRDWKTDAYADLAQHFNKAELSVLRGEKSLSEASECYSIKYKTLQGSIRSKINKLKNKSIQTYYSWH